MSELKFTKEHEWVLFENGIATVGITDFAVEELGEIVYVELPEPETELLQMSEFGSVESVKTVSTLYAPVGGTVVAVNTELKEQPEMINESPYDNGWMIKIKCENTDELDALLSQEAYDEFISN